MTMLNSNSDNPYKTLKICVSESVTHFFLKQDFIIERLGFSFATQDTHTHTHTVHTRMYLCA